MIDDYLALIPAAGVGARAQLSTAKQFLKIGEKTILEHAIDPFLKDENCKKICVVTNEDDDLWPSMSMSNQIDNLNKKVGYKISFFNDFQNYMKVSIEK